MNHKRFSLKDICFYLFLFLSSIGVAQAQSTISNIPSTDVQPVKTAYLEVNFSTHPTKDQNEFKTYGTLFLYGVSKKLEVGVNACYSKASGEVLPVEIQPNAKWQIYNNEEKGVAFSTGAMLFIPVAHRRGADTSGMVYFSASKKIKGDYTPRLTGGSYVLISKSEGVTKAGGFAGFEQPLNRRMSFVADWASGNNQIGYGAVGLSIALSKRSLLYAGYGVGNNGRGNNYMTVSYGYSF